MSQINVLCANLTHFYVEKIYSCHKDTCGTRSFSLPKTILSVCMHVRTDGFKFPKKKNSTLSSERETASGIKYTILKI